MNTPSMIRQMWIENATIEFRAHFTRFGYQIPAEVRVSVGFPKGSHGGKKQSVNVGVRRRLKTRIMKFSFPLSWGTTAK